MSGTDRCCSPLKYFHCIFSWIWGYRAYRGLTLRSHYFSFIVFPPSFIPLVSEFTLNFVGEILQYNSYCTVCPLTRTVLCFYVFTATQCNISTSVGHLHFLPPYKKPLCPLVVLPFPPVLATTSPLSVPYVCVCSGQCIWMRIVFWLFLLSLSIMFLRFSLHCIIRNTTFFCHGLRKFCCIKYGPFQCPLRSRRHLDRF